MRSWLVVAWSTRIRWRRKEILAGFCLFPLLLLATYCHLHFLVNPLARRLRFEDRFGFLTYHQLCRSCARRIRIRQYIHGVIFFIAASLGILSAAIILGVLVVAAIFGDLARLSKDDIIRIAPCFFLVLVIPAAAMVLSRTFEKILILPRALIQLVKCPFRYDLYEFRTPQTLHHPIKL
jgi:hypothetical protein